VPLTLRLALAIYLGNDLGLLLLWLCIGAFAWKRTLVAEAQVRGVVHFESGEAVPSEPQPEVGQRS
jgi:hypothetical protein